jgi:DNA-binding beta-propeller fold protein YncE
MKRFLWLGFVLLVYGICTGCGDTFRPIIIPNPPVFPNPAAAHTVVTISDNGTIVPGSAMVTDVSGDTDLSIGNVGLAPVHAVQQTGTQVLVVNHSVPGPQNTGDSITKLDFSNLVISSTSTITLPANSGPTFIAVAPSSTIAYVTLPNYVDPTTSNVIPSVGVVNTLSDTLQIPPITVGNDPDALAVTPDNSKLYVANSGDNTVSGFNTVDQSQRTGSPAGTTSPPIWLTARSDSQAVYVLEQNGPLASISTVSTAGPDPLTEYPELGVVGATTMTYDSNLNRLYIPGGQEMEIVDVSQSQPQSLATIPMPQFTLLNLPPVNATAVAVAALPDGSRAYVASYATLPSQVSISAVTGDGTNATYAYTLTAGQDLTAGVSVTVAGTQQNGFDGAFLVAGIVSGTSVCPGKCFQVPNTTTLPAMQVSASATGSNIFPQVTVVSVTSNTIKTTIPIPGFPDATLSGSLYYVPVCATTRFRFMMAAGGDSSRAYLSSCDGGAVNIIDTTTDTYTLNLPAPVSTRPPFQGYQENPPQNPVFLIAGP